MPPIEWYWKVTLSGTPTRKEYYRTLKEPQDFRNHFTGLYPGCKIVGVTEGGYNALSKNKRKVHK